MMTSFLQNQKKVKSQPDFFLKILSPCLDYSLEMEDNDLASINKKVDDKKGTSI